MRLRLPVIVLATALALAACGGGDDSASVADDATVEDQATATEESMEDMSEGDAMDDGMSEDESMDDMGDMDMGDPDATPAYAVEGAELVQGDFVLLDSAPEGFADAAGTAYLARGEMTTATLEVTGLEADTDYVSHVHAESCEASGGPHFKFDADGGDMPPNEIHLSFTTDGDGSGAITATNEMVAGDDARSVVVHQASGDQTKALCADLG